MRWKQAIGLKYLAKGYKVCVSSGISEDRTHDRTYMYVIINIRLLDNKLLYIGLSTGTQTEINFKIILV